MFNAHRAAMHRAYRDARKFFVKSPKSLIAAEKHIHSVVAKIIREHIDEFRQDYDEASYIFPFWQNYPPKDRGRSPRGDQYPWIEVGEHSIGCKLARYLADHFQLRDVGLPSGTDQRFLVKSKELKKYLKLTDQVMLFCDVKSVGPRDDFEHTVLSPYQVSGDGIWENVDVGLKNSPIAAFGLRRKHKFHCALPPIYILSDKTIAPTVSVFIKPVYRMLSQRDNITIDSLIDSASAELPQTNEVQPLPATQTGDAVSQRIGHLLEKGQPLSRITLVSLPNGLLLTQNPNYLSKRKGLFFPGKDDKKIDAGRRRARISFNVLKGIAKWRVETIKVR